MIRYPWMVFQDTASTGVEKIPLDGNVQIIDAGGGEPKYITVIDLANLGGTILTIADLLAAPTQWIGLNVSPERGGVAWNALETYSIGDTVTDTLDFKAYRCIVAPAAVGTEPSTDSVNWVIIGLPTEVETGAAPLQTHKGKSITTSGIEDDASWSMTLTSPSLLRTDYTVPDDSEVNHILAGPFDTATFTLTIPAGNTLTIV